LSSVFRITSCVLTAKFACSHSWNHILTHMRTRIHVFTHEINWRLIFFWQQWNLYNVTQGWHLPSALLIHMPNHTRFQKRMKKAIKSSGSQRSKRMEQADSRRSLEATPAMFAAVVTMATLTTLAPSCLSSSTLSVSASTQIFSSCRKVLTAKL